MIALNTAITESLCHVAVSSAFFCSKKSESLTNQHTISYFANVSISYSLETERETLTSYLMRVCLTVDYTSQ